MKKIKCWCLTVNGNERHIEMQKHLESIPNLDYEFVYGKSYGDCDIDFEPISRNKKYWELSEFSHHDNYIRNAYSCAMGHMEMMERFIKSNAEWGLICEDDIRLYPSVIDDLEKIVRTYNKALYHLCTENYLLYSGQIDKISNTIELRTGRVGYMAACYLTNKAFAKRYIATNTPISFPADIAIWKTLNYNIPVIYGLPITYSEFQIKSLIGDEKR